MENCKLNLYFSKWNSASGVFQFLNKSVRFSFHWVWWCEAILSHIYRKIKLVMNRISSLFSAFVFDYVNFCKFFRLKSKKRKFNPMKWGTFGTSNATAFSTISIVYAVYSKYIFFVQTPNTTSQWMCCQIDQIAWIIYTYSSLGYLNL